MKKITLMKNLATAAIFALAISSTVSCDPEEKKVDEKTYMIELANPLDKDIMIDPEQTEDITVGLKLTNLTKEQLTIDQGNQEWCYASFSTDKDEIILVHGENSDAQDLVAEFTVSADVTGAEPLKFKVTKRGSEVEIFVEISSPDITTDEYGGNTFTIPSAAKTLTITVSTNAATWYLSEMNMVTDDNYQPIEWYTVDKNSGRNGETCTITFSENKSSDDRKAQFIFAEEENAYMGASVMVTQYGPAATYAKAIIDYDEENPVSGSYDLAFAAEDSGYMGSFDFELEKDGSIEFKWMKTGTMEEDATATDWISISAAYGYSIVPTANTTGAARSIDLVILPAGGTTELFRFKITQAAE